MTLFFLFSETTKNYYNCIGVAEDDSLDANKLMRRTKRLIPVKGKSFY